MRELKCYVACSVDGFIARADGSFDFFPMEGEHLVDLVKQFPETVPTHLRKALNVDSESRTFDTVLMGRKTCQADRILGRPAHTVTSANACFLDRWRQVRTGRVELVSSGPLSFVRQLKQESGKDIWLCGGAALATALFPEIDELILKVNSVLIGSGIPLFSAAVEPACLRLTSSKTYSNGFILNRYRVLS